VRLHRRPATIGTVRLLVLGGTWFLGRVLVEAALQRGHSVTTFNRGKSGVDAPGVEPVRGDRGVSVDLARLSQLGRWDAVIDTSAFVPRVALSSARALAERVDRYLLVSTVSVYSEWPNRGVGEASPIRECAPDAGPGPAGVYGTYGTLKAGCERAVHEWFGGRDVVLRPGVILGPHENIGRLPWWLHRTHRGGRVLAPGPPDRTIQPVDVRDVAAFALSCLETGTTGTFNVAAPRGRATYGDLLRTCVEVTGSDAELVWVAEGFLAERGVRQWTELPIWRIAPGTWEVTAERAAAAGLVCRPLIETVRDTWRWLSAGGTPVEHIRKGEHGIDPKKEGDLLSAWEGSAGHDPRDAAAGDGCVARDLSD
jgi:nucleoside-diphosphate-sugar epimerase